MQAAQEQVLTSVDDRKATRIELKRRVVFRFASLEGFMTEYLLNLSATGMFIRCQDPQPKGSVLDFEFSLAEGEHLIRGGGEVMWCRRRDGGLDKPAGMGIRFLHLDDGTLELLRWFVTRRYITGGGPCDMEELEAGMRRTAAEDSAVFTPPEQPAPGSPVNAQEALDRPAGPTRSPSHGAYREVGYGRARGEKRSLRLPLAAAVIAAVLGGIYGLSRIAVPVAAWTQARSASVAIEPAAPAEPAATTNAIEPVEPAAEETPPVAVEATGEAATHAPEPAASPGAAIPAAAAQATAAGVAELAKAWAVAWSRQDLEAYLACYATEFRPPDGRDRGAWEASRRARILKPKTIEVRVDGFAAELLEADRARVRFRQSYRSDSYRDVVDKTLELVREDGAWRIVEERADG